MDELELLNRRVAGLDDELFPDPPPGRNVFIVGAPRSGTTLVSQGMAWLFEELGYINNVAAAFWNAPAFGVRFGQRFAKERSFSGQSSHGQTHLPGEPHEFGRFWRTRLSYEGMVQKTEHRIDWQSLIRSLDQIGQAWERPVFYKVFQLAWHLAEMDQQRRDSRWIFVTRDLPGNVRSLMKLASDRGDRWTSAVPKKALQNFDHSEPWQRVTAQVVYMNQWIDSELAQLDPRRQFRIRLSDLAAQPKIEMQRLAQFLNLTFDESRIARFAANLEQRSAADDDWSRQVNRFAESLP